MKVKALSVGSLAVLGGIVILAASHAASQSEGLVAVQSRNFDELYLSSSADFAGYRKVMIDPVRVEFHSDWLRYRYRYAHDVTRPVAEWNIKRIAENTAADAQASLAEAFRARGYEIATAPAPSVLRLTPSVVDLYVNAPDRLSPWRSKTFTRDAGDALLLLEARDAVSGTLLGRAVHRGTAQQLGRFARANDVSNRFWFEALFRRWAANCVAALETGATRP